MLYGLADCNNFFVSCERVFRPDLAHKAVVVLSNNDGCAISRSQEAKDMGIKMGQPLFEFQSLVNAGKVVAFSSNFALYGNMSNRVMSLLGNYTPCLEQYSIDESFLDLSGLKKNNEEYHEYGVDIVRTIRRAIGIPISLGIAPTRTLAKMASKYAKKYKGYKGCCVINTAEAHEKALKLFAIEDVFGIGRRYLKKLNQAGVKTAWDFTQLSAEFVQNMMTITGLRTWQELRGKDCITLDNLPMKKSITCSRSFANGITELRELEGTIGTFVADVARKMRSQKSVGTQMLIFANTSPFVAAERQNYIQLQITFPVPTADTLQMTNAAVSALRQHWQNKGFIYKRAGVMVWNLTSGSIVQGDLFDQRDVTKLNKLWKAIDTINSKNGNQLIKTAVQGKPQRDMMAQNHRSPEYTTNWKELWTIKI